MSLFAKPYFDTLFKKLESKGYTFKPNTMGPNTHFRSYYKPDGTNATVSATGNVLFTSPNFRMHYREFCK